jgi:hypothetical protein
LLPAGTRNGTLAMPRKESDKFDVMKWWLRSRDGIDDVQDRDISRSCSSKDGYRTEAEARAHAAMNGMSGVLFTYRCTYCDQWHLTRRKT